MNTSYDLCGVYVQVSASLVHGTADLQLCLKVEVRHFQHLCSSALHEGLPSVREAQTQAAAMLRLPVDFRHATRSKFPQPTNKEHVSAIVILRFIVLSTVFLGTNGKPDAKKNKHTT